MRKAYVALTLCLILLSGVCLAQQRVLPVVDSTTRAGSSALLTATASAPPLETTPYWESNDSLLYATGMIWEDCNNDGYIDLFVSNGNDIVKARNAIYLSDEGRLPRAASWYSDNFEFSGHCGVGDIDDDGFPDFLVANLVGDVSHPWTSNLSDLYMNSSGLPETSPSWQTGDSLNTFSCALGDPDGDGDLDAAFATGTAYFQNLDSPDRIYFNNDGSLQTLPDWMSAASTNAMDVTWGDVDNDGDLDLAFCYDLAAAAVYYNNDGVIETSPSWQALEQESGNTLVFGDINNDGWLDLIVACNNQFGEGGYFRAYFNNGSGQLYTGSGWQSATAGYGSALALYDYDNDGDDDLAAGRWFDRPRVYENIGGTFTTTPVWQADIASVPEEMAWVDVDRDGCEPWADTIIADGERKLFYTRKHPLYCIDSIVVDGAIIENADFCYDLVSGWVSLAEAPAAEIIIYYQFSFRNDLAIVNWNTRNRIYANTFWKVAMYSDVTSGMVPLIVQFYDTSFGATSWLWDFGDGTTADQKSPTHIYFEAGAYDVSLTVVLPGETAERTIRDMILALADTVTAGNIVAAAGSEIAVTLRARNTFPLHRIDIPLEFGGDLALHYDSFSTVGCRTEYFADQGYIHWDANSGKRVNVRLRLDSDGSQAELPPGEGDVIKFHFTVDPAADANLTTNLQLDGYVSGANEYEPTFYSDMIDCHPWPNDGAVSTPCCQGIRGNMDGDASEEVTMDDIVYMVDWAFNGGPPPVCLGEADVNGVGGIDIEDLVYLVEYVYHGGDAPSGCF